ETEAVDRSVIRNRPETVDRVRWDVHEIALADFAVLTFDGHDAAAGCHVIELVRRVGVRVDIPTTRHLELAHQLEITAVGDVFHLAWRDQPPHGHGSVVLDDRSDVLDRANVHPPTPLSAAT